MSGYSTVLPEDVETGDADHAGLHNDVNDQVNFLTGELAGLNVDPLEAWRRNLAANPSTVKIVLSGDSTSDSAAQAGDLLNRLKNLHTLRGEALDGVTAANIVALGYNGSTLAAWLADATKLAALVTADPDLVVASWGINDVRTGQTDQATMRARLVSYVDAVRTALPGVPIVLRIPSAFTTTNSGGSNYVTSAGGSVNPAGAAQTYSTLLRQAYLSLTGVYSDVLIADQQADVMGVQSLSASPLMGDQIHPSVAGSSFNSVPWNGGQVAVADYIAGVIGHKRGTFPPGGKGDFQNVEKFTVLGGGNGYVDLCSPVANGLAASQVAIAPGDKLHIEGLAGPIDVPGAGNLLRPQAGSNIRLLIAGTDFTSYVGRNAWVGYNHAGATTEDRQIVSVNLGSIAANTIDTSTTVAVTGARAGDSGNGDATAIGVAPPASFHAGGLVLFAAYATADNTVRLVIQNPTGGAIDLAAANWAFWLIR